MVEFQGGTAFSACMGITYFISVSLLTKVWIKSLKNTQTCIILFKEIIISGDFVSLKGNQMVFNRLQSMDHQESRAQK